MIPLIAPASIEQLEYTVPCGVEGCDHDANWASYGEHSIFGCPGTGFVCDFHRMVTLRYMESIDGATGTCRCGRHRVASPDEFRFIAL